MKTASFAAILKAAKTAAMGTKPFQRITMEPWA